MIKMLVAVINDVDRVESILKKLEEGGVTSVPSLMVAE